MWSIVYLLCFSDSLMALKQLVAQPIKLEGDGATDFFLIKSIDKVRPVLPCVDRSPIANSTLLRELERINVVIGRLYEKHLPAGLYMDKVCLI